MTSSAHTPHNGMAAAGTGTRTGIAEATGAAGATRATEASRVRRPRATRLLGLLPSVALLLGAVSCTDQPDELSTPCGVVVDGSGSGAATKNGFDAKKKLEHSLVPFLKDQECGTVEFAPITRTSLSSACTVDKVDLDPPHSPTTDVAAERNKALVVAAKESLEELECARDDRPGSDVWGGIDRIAEKMPTDGPAAKLLVVSDFLEADSEFTIGHAGNISTDARRKSSIDELVRRRGLPAVQGMTIFPVGYGMKYAKSPSAQKQFEAFWTEVLEERAKADVDTEYQ